MKRIVLIALTAALLLALAACGNAAQEQEKNNMGYTNMANPWTDVDSAEAAAEGAGVGYFMVPEKDIRLSISPMDITAYRCMKGVAQANGYIGAAEMTIRKGLKQDYEDVSGDYNAYKLSWTQELDGVQVQCFGNVEDQAIKTIWVTDNFSYSLNVRGQGDTRDTFGLNAADVAALVAGIQ